MKKFYFIAAANLAAWNSNTVERKSGPRAVT
jgi:hypothetical protein